MNAQTLNKKRNFYRALTMICLCVEILAVVLMFTVHKPLGLAVGLIAFVVYFVITRVGKRKINDEVARIQTRNLGMENFKYIGRQEVDKHKLAAAELLPSRYALDTPVYQHVATGSLRGRDLTVGEITLSFPKQAGKQGREFNNGAFVMTTLKEKVKTPMVLLGNKPFMVGLTREDYAKDGYTQCPIGGKGKGWYAFTPGNDIPDEKILAAWEALAADCGGQAALAVRGKTVYAFFCSRFTTDTFQLSEEITDADLKKKVFTYLPRLADVFDAMEAE